MNAIEAMKAAKDGLDVLPDLLRYAAEDTPVDEIPAEDLDRMKWYGVFHRKQTPGRFMLRLRTPGGRLTAVQLRALAEIARDFGQGTADLTTRQNVQLRGLTLPQIPEVLRRLQAAGISTQQTGLDNVRNLIGCPLAGVATDEMLDTTALMQALQQAWLGRKAYSNLPRKINISLAGCREDCGHAQTQDIGFVPATRDGQDGFNVLVGGALGGTSPRLATPLDVWLAPSQIVPFTLALLEVFRDHGPREQRTKARLKWLIAAWGEARLRAEIAARLPFPLAPAGAAQTRRVAGDHLGIHPQREPGLRYAGLHVPVGRITAAQLAELGRLAEEYGRGEVRLTIGQNVIVPFIPQERIPRLLREPLLAELRPNPASIWRNLVACTGNDYCHFSLIDTKTRAVELAATLEARGVELAPDTRIHVSGCVHACGKHHVADLGLVGTNVRVEGRVIEAVHVLAGGALGEDGRLAHPVRDNVRFEELPLLAERLLRPAHVAAIAIEDDGEIEEDAA